MTDTQVAPEMWAPATRDGAAAEYIAAPSLTFWQDVRKRLWANKPAMLGLGFIILLVLAAIFGPMLSRHTYFEQNLKLSNVPPLFQTYEVTDSTGATTRFFFNSGNLNLYEVTPSGEVAGLLRPAKKDLIKKQQQFKFGDKQVVLDTAKQQLSFADGAALTPSGWQWNMSNLLGTDQLGRDVLARQLYGARISLTVAFVATLVNFFIGVFYGGLAGYLGGKADTIMMRIVEVISTIPLTLYVILIMVVFNSGFLSVVLAIGSVYWVDMARIVRGQILTLKQQDYVAAARTMGASTPRILVRHLLPNSVGPILVTLTMLIPSAIFIESFMSFIGLGVTPPEASWGTLTSEAVETLRAYPYQLFFPAAAISLAMFAFNFLGDGLRDALDPRLRA
ncbi:peptide ABC transporter permease [Devosia insulae DS-56]|uniref:Peptide ABC transporter permease n=1 Tax=Devosia insulae DS-56 TaxID=1116389 RepID=A0A1E5XS28_9HYPH|nr:ABC transporter permease [Devosia insulae]OEO31399.1 peptide ABC transporter permease [Devosia insulae DS-56]